MDRKNKKGGSSPEWVRFAAIGFMVVFGLNLWQGILQGKNALDQNQALALESMRDLRQGFYYLQARDLDRANTWFAESQNSLENLSKSLTALTSQANVFLDQNLYLKTAEKLIRSGLIASRLGQTFASLVQEAEALPALSAKTEWVPLLQDFDQKINGLFAQALELQNHLTAVNPRLLPMALRPLVPEAQEQMGEFLALLKQGGETVKGGLQLLGEKSPHHMLVLFQNKYERRATGGFIGSYALITLNEGKMVKLDPKDVYETDSQLSEKIPPPPGIDQVADNWYLRDANTSPDFPTSAKKIMWFLEHSRGPSVDTVIALDQTVAEKALELTGPVFLKGVPFQIHSGNFNDFFSYVIESRVLGEGSPKKLLFELVSGLQKKAGALQDWKAAVSALGDLKNGGHIQVFSQNPAIQQVAEAWGMDGRFIAAAPKTDFLSVISTSVGGNKSDRFIETVVEHQTHISARGSVLNQLTISKHHTWSEADFRRFKKVADYYGGEKLSPSTLRFILGEGPNRDYLRVYVPFGSKLLSSTVDTVAVSEDLGYTVFGFTMEVQPGATRAISLEYELPFTLSLDPVDSYRLITQKQAGAENIQFKKRFTLTEGLEMVNEYPANPSAFSLSPSYEMPFEKNQIFLAALKSFF